MYKIKAKYSFSGIPLFMSTRGKADIHRDLQDYITVMLLTNSPKDMTNGVILHNVHRIIDWSIGDIIILDSAVFYHSTVDYDEVLSKFVFQKGLMDRIVSLWIIHKIMLTHLKVKYSVIV